MRALESIWAALRALRSNGMRSMLTMLGILLGVSAVVCMMAIGEGARAQVAEKIRKLGTNLLYVQPDGRSGARHSLTEDDAKALLREVPGIEISAPIIWGAGQVVAGNRNWETTVWGNDADYLAAREWPLAAGRLFSADEIATGAQVAIIGQVIVRKLFGGEAHVGETIRIGQVPFTVIGILDSKGEGGSGKSQDDMVVVPLSAARSRLLGVRRDPEPDGAMVRREEENNRKREGKSGSQTLQYQHQVSRQALDYLVVKFDTAASAPDVVSGIEEVLRDRHRLRGDDPDDFTIYNPADALITQEASTKSFGLLIISIASISLAIGGISIMNTMLVSVAERTREIGLRMAVGARRQDIRNQFLVEAVVLAVLGGIFGVAVGSATAAAIARYGGWPILISPAVILLACGFTGIVGVTFGSFPAYRASRLDPMIALRTE